MKQIFTFGASITYGVGGANGGWADMVKLALHARQYGEDFDERYEFYNFSRPGMVVAEVLESMDGDIKYRKHDESEVIIIMSIGLNNTKSIDRADNYVSSLDDYRQEMKRLLEKAKGYTGKVIFVGYTPVNEEVMNNRTSPITGEKTFFYNKRIAEFNMACSVICKEMGVEYLALFDEAKELDWKKYLTKDGLHLNARGHKWEFEKVWALLQNWL